MGMDFKKAGPLKAHLILIHLSSTSLSAFRTPRAKT